MILNYNGSILNRQVFNIFMCQEGKGGGEFSSFIVLFHNIFYFRQFIISDDSYLQSLRGITPSIR